MERLHEVEALLSLCSRNDQPLKERSEAARKDNAILRGALVLLCSHIEGYFEDLVGDALDTYVKVAADIDDIPKEILAYQIIGRPERWNNCGVLKRWEIVQECIRHPLVCKERSGLAAVIKSEIHTAGFANPGSTEIEDLFKTIGINKVWDQFTKIESDRLIMDTVNIIVHRRNQIAHGQMESTVARDDVEAYVTKSRRLAEVMDSVVGSAICEALKIGCAWSEAEQGTT